MNPALTSQAEHYAAVRARLWPARRPLIAIRQPPKHWSTPTITLVSDSDDARIRLALRAIGFRRVTSRLVAREIAAAFSVTADDLIGQSRKPQFTKPRMIGMAVAFRLLKNSVRGSKRRIGRDFGGRDHSTVWHAINRYGELVERVIGVSE